MANAAATRVGRTILLLPKIILATLGFGLGFPLATTSRGQEPEAPRKPELMTAEALLNICRYIEWPEEVFVTKRSPIVFGIYGQTTIAREIEAKGKDWMANGRRIFVREFSWPATPNCNVLFIASTEKVRLPLILKKVEHAPVLTISESEDFTPEGCMARVYTQNGKPRFQFNMAAVTNAHRKLSAQLKQVADVNWVEPREESPKPSKQDPPPPKKPVRMKNAE